MTIQAMGGVFFRADDPEKLGAWYQEHFGLNPGGATSMEAGPLVFAPFSKDTDYFGSEQQFMFNFRVENLEATLTELAAAGIKESKPRETMDGVGHFGWVTDPEGNRIELWQMLLA